MMLGKIRHNIFSYSSKGFGIHSPFVFDFQKNILHPSRLQDGIYKQYGREPDKGLRVLTRMQYYYGLDSLLIYPKFYQLGVEKYGIQYSSSSQKGVSYDLLVLDACEHLHEDYNLKEHAFALIVGKSHLVRQHPLVSKCQVFLDLYSMGICIFKKGMSEQFFKLKF